MIHWRLSSILKTSSKRVWGNVLWYRKVNILWKFIQYTIYCDKTNTKEISLGQNKHYKKNALIFLLRAPTHHSLTFNSQFFYELKHKFHLSKTVWDFPFSIPSRFYWFIFLFKKSVNSLNLKHCNSIKNKNSRKATHSFAPRLLIFKLQQEVWKFNDTYLSWSFPETDQETSFLNLKNRSFEYIFFSQ